jgi:hypothetical protein
MPRELRPCFKGLNENGAEIDRITLSRWHTSPVRAGSHFECWVNFQPSGRGFSRARSACMACDNAVMPKFHHANLGVPPDFAEAEADFLVGILGYRRLAPPQAAADFGARWYEADDGTQVHLSLDPDHVPASMAHTAIDICGESDEVERRLTDAGIPFKTAEFDGNRILLCKDPAGNRWELRG